eukprot:TRINITY_DN1108_c0_g1_i1.p1 TRINITY_DN1108_c0_g1~~TRINITY_DN1108_c0_g1_i1.p1  ORF type:complete len:893 (-),score=209.49 TRINITY_DN1108_c0_g1_i1:548-3226(-)
MSSVVSINVMLAIHAKKTLSTDMYRPLRQYIVSHYSEQEAKDNEEDLQDVQKMRNDVEKQVDGLEQRRDTLQKYYRALSVMETRFPISPEKEHVNTLYFTWFDAFKQIKKVSQQNIHFEKAGVVFNLAAIQSQLGLSADRTNPEGLKQACNCFQSSAGAFAYLRDNISMKATGGANASNTTIDITMECAGMLERLMLAQAQECFYEKVVGEGRPNSLCSRVSKQVGMFYEEAYASLILPPLNQHFDKSWVSHVQLKAAQFQAEAFYRLAVHLHQEESIAEEIARLKAATVVIAEAKKNGKGVVGPLMDSITKLETNITRNLATATKENDRVYLMRVPANETLPPVPAASLVSPYSQQEVLDASKEKMFPNLVPDSSAKALSKYTEMVDDIIRTQAEKLQNESDLTRVRLQEMDLPDSILALEGGASLPEQLRDDVEAVQIDGGPAGLPREMAQLRDLRRVNEELLVQTEEILEKEAREDAQIRTQFGTKWTRPASTTLTKNLHDRANGFAANLRQAGESDGRIERAIKDNEQLLSILAHNPIDGALPKLSRPIVSVHGDADAIAQRLKQLVGELEKLGSQRAGLEDMLKDMKRKDNILPQLMNTTGSYDDLFKREIAKYTVICEQVSKNIEAQDLLLQQIKVQSDAFAAAFNLQEHKATKEKTMKQITAAVAKYREIRENMNEGLKFYVTLQDAITALKQQCGDYVMTRSIQSSDMMRDIQHQIAGFTFNDSSSASRNYPAPQQATPQAPPQPAGSPQQKPTFFNMFGGKSQPQQQQQQQPQSQPPPSATPASASAPPQYYAPQGAPPPQQPPGGAGYYAPQQPPQGYYAAGGPPAGGYSGYPQGGPPGQQAGGHWQGQPPPSYYQQTPGGPTPQQQQGYPYQPPGGYYRQG